MCSTSSENITSLQPLATGLVNRYEAQQQPPPQLLYTDRDCCNQHGPSKYETLFSTWTLLVRLDIWHWMRRLAAECCTEAHPLYGQFMSCLSNAIFEWEESDVTLLVSTKRAEMREAGVSHVSDTAVKNAITREELARHCRRRTRGEETVKAIENLLLSFSASTDSLGVPLLKPEIVSIWKEKQRHVQCIQDPPNLYTQVSTTKKGGLLVPVYRCARGSTSLESFHSHLIHFIPGTSASAVNFQAYILEGITRWNCARAASACQEVTPLRTFDTRLKYKVML